MKLKGNSTFDPNISFRTSLIYVKVKKDGKYYVMMTDSSGCSYRSNTITFSTLPEAMQYEFHIYPNPSDGKINILYYGIPLQDLQLEIINTQGETLYTAGSVKLPASLDISNLNPGIYFVRIISGEQGCMLKFIKI